MSSRDDRPVSDRLAALAAEVSKVAPGLAIGQRAPGFSLPDALGHRVDLARRLARGPVVLSFYRGQWCPFCNLQLKALQAALPQIRGRGAALMAISPQVPDHSLSLIEKHQLSFDILSDVRQQVSRAYRVHYTLPADAQDLYLNVFGRNLPAQNADGSWDLPVPATFIVDRHGIIRARHVSADYTTRLDPVEIEAALSALA